MRIKRELRNDVKSRDGEDNEVQYRFCVTYGILRMKDKPTNQALLKRKKDRELISPVNYVDEILCIDLIKVESVIFYYHSTQTIYRIRKVLNVGFENKPLALEDK